MKTTLAALTLLLAVCGGVFLFGPVSEDTVAQALGRIGPPLEGKGEARIIAFGDMMFDRQIRSVSEAQGGEYLFSCVDPLIKQADFAVANLEGPITDHASLSQGSAVGSTDNFYFTFPTTTAALLARHGFKAVSIGNNHILNFGLAGLTQTQTYLSRAGLGYFGGTKGNEGVFETEDEGVPLAFVAYNEFGGSSPGDVADEIKAEHDAGRVVIVYAHWGDEYVDASPRLRPIAEQFAQAGASAIIGAHPHVVLGHEYIDSTLVYYSLGNFIFDQYWTDSVDHGLALILTITRDGKVAAEEHPVVLNRSGQTCEAVQ